MSCSSILGIFPSNFMRIGCRSHSKVRTRAYLSREKDSDSVILTTQTLDGHYMFLVGDSVGIALSTPSQVVRLITLSQCGALIHSAEFRSTLESEVAQWVDMLFKRSRLQLLDTQCAFAILHDELLDEFFSSFENTLRRKKPYPVHERIHRDNLAYAL